MQLKKDVMNKTPSVVARLLVGCYLALLIALGSARLVVPDTIAVTEEEINNASAAALMLLYFVRVMKVSRFFVFIMRLWVFAE